MFDNIPASIILCINLKLLTYNDVKYNIDETRKIWCSRIMSYNEIDNPNPFYTKPMIDVYYFVKWNYKTHNTHPINTQNTITTLLLIMQNIHIQNLNKPRNSFTNTPRNSFPDTILIEYVMSNIIYNNYDFININKSIKDNLDNIKLSFTTN